MPEITQEMSNNERDGSPWWIKYAGPIALGVTLLLTIGGGWNRLSSVETRQDRLEVEQRETAAKLSEISGDMKLLLERTKPH